MHALKNKFKGKKGYYALKLDFTKALDSVNWTFLKKVFIEDG